MEDEDWGVSSSKIVLYFNSTSQIAYGVSPSLYVRKYRLFNRNKKQLRKKRRTLGCANRQTLVSGFPIWNLSWTTNPNTSTEKRQWGRSLTAIRHCYWLRAAPSALPRDGSPEKQSHLCHQKLKHPLFSFEEEAGPPSPLTEPCSGTARCRGTCNQEGGEKSATEPHSTVSVLSWIIRYLFNNCRKGQPNSYHQALRRFDILGIVS